MIRTSAYTLMIVLIFGLMESIILAYDYFTVIMLALFFTVAVDILIFNLLETKTAAGLRMSRSIRTVRLAKGGITHITVTLSNSSKTYIQLEYEDELSETLLAAGNRGIVSIKGGGTAEFEYTVTAPFCGRHRIGPLRVSLTDPFRFCRQSIELDSISTVQVDANPPAIESARRETSRRISARTGIRQIARGGQGYQFFRIRQYAEGDDLRSIVWSRYGNTSGDDIYVKEMQEERTREIIFLIDYGAGTIFGNRKRRMYDDIISAVLESAGEVIRMGDRVGFLFHSTKHCHYIPAGNARTSLTAARSFVSDSIPEGRFLLGAGIREARKRIGKSTAVIVISPMLDRQNFKPEMFYLLSGGSVSAVLLRTGGYVEENDDDLRMLLLKGVAYGKDREVRNICRFLSLSGMRTIMSSAEELQTRVMQAWAYGRMINAGS